MNKKGFSLSELLVVIAIVAIITVIAVPSVITINKNINKRMYSDKVDKIVAAAELYATNNPDIFNGTDEVRIKVSELLVKDYLKQDVAKGESNCKNSSADGCVIDPRDNSSMNNKEVVIRKKTVGVVAEFDPKGDGSKTVEGTTLVEQVCDGFDKNLFVGKWGPEDNDKCKCGKDSNGVTGIYKLDATGAIDTSSPVQACIIAGSDPNNWLKYDGVEWRVLGLYNIHNDGRRLSAKMITHQTVDVQ